MRMMVLCLMAGSLALTPPGDEMSNVVSRCLPRRQLWVSNLSKVATQWFEVDSNLRPSGCKAENIYPYTPTSPPRIISIFLSEANQILYSNDLAAPNDNYNHRSY